MTPSPWSRRVWSILASMRLAVALLCGLALAATIGAVVPQSPTTPQADNLHRSYGVFWYFVIRLFHLGDVFHSWWFLALLGVFSLNLGACTTRRLLTSLRVLRSPVQPLVGHDVGDSLTIGWSGARLSPEGLRGAVRRVLRRRGARVLEVDGQLVGERWRYSRLSPDLVHIGILLILTGAFLGLFRFQGKIYVSESDLGEAILPCSTDQATGSCLRGVPFGLRVDAFGAEVYPGGVAYSAFWTDVVILEEGQEVRRGRVELNRPLVYRGLSFYQSFYGFDVGAAQITLLVVDWERRRSVGSFSLNVGDSVRVPETDDVVVFAQFFTSLALDSEGVPHNASTPSPQNPAARLVVYRDLGLQMVPLYSDVILAQHPAPHSSTGGPYRFHLEDFRVPRYVGLTYSRDPGYPLVWWGFFIVMLGLLMAFFLRPRRVWVVFDLEHERLRLLGGPRARSSSKEWFEAIARAVERELKGGD